MTDRRQWSSTDRSDRASTSNRGDRPSRLDRTSPSSEHPARSENLRFSNIDPSTWGQASQSQEVSSQMTDHGRDLKRKEPEGETSQDQSKRARTESPRPTSSHPDTWEQDLQSSEHSKVREQIEKLIASQTENVSNQRGDFSPDELRAIHQKLIYSLPQADQVKQYIDKERKHLLNNTVYHPFDKQRAIHQKWVDSLPEKYQEEQHTYLINEERENLLIDTEDLDFEERRDNHQKWVQSLPEKYQEEQHTYLINKEGENLLNQTSNLPIDQQRQAHQAWVDLLPQEFQEDQSLLLLYSERQFLFHQTGGLPSDQRRETYQNWFASLRPEYQAIQPSSFIDSEIQLFSLEMINLHGNELRARSRSWLTSFSQEERRQIFQRLQEHSQSIPQHLIEQFEKEEQNRQQHLERVQTTIREKNLGIDVPDQSTDEWGNFAANLISEHEEKHGLGSSGVLGDILQGGTRKEVSWDEIRNGEEYKDLMSWVLRSWRDYRSQRDRNNV